MHHLDWSGRTAVVTGAGTGIGAATAVLLAGRGARVVGVGPDGAALEAVGARIAAVGDGAFVPSIGDVTVEADRAAALALAGERLDLLVNNAAVFLLAGVDATPEQWNRTLEVNLLAPARLATEARTRLSAARGSIVNIASISAHIAQAGRWTYNSAKAALVELTRCQALDLAPDGIRVNSVSPGWIWTEALDDASDGDRDRWEPVWGAYAPLGRCGEPEEVAEAVAFLGSGASSFITGTDLPVDGGYLAAGPEGAASIRLER